MKIGFRRAPGRLCRRLSRCGQRSSLDAARSCSSTNTGGAGATSAPPPCVVDTTEPNETFLTKTQLGSIHDDDVVGTKPEASPNKIDKYFSIHTPTDVDWYEVDVNDTGIGGNPQIEVMVDNGFAATALWTCIGKTTAVVCGVGTKVDHDPDIGDAQGCELVQPPSSGSDVDHGRVPRDSASGSVALW